MKEAILNLQQENGTLSMINQTQIMEMSEIKIMEIIHNTEKLKSKLWITTMLTF